MKILITGAAGTLAAAVGPALLRDGHNPVMTDINQRVPDIRNMDISDRDSVRSVMDSQRPDYVFHFAAATDVDACEKDPGRAFLINAAGTENIALACRDMDVSLLYVSTGAVFYGDKPEPYTESDTPRPLNVYGKSKLAGEAAVQGILKKYFIIRAGWMIGGWDLDKKFVYKVIQQLRQGKKELTAVNDKFGSPTFTKDFAARLTAIINTGRYGIYHLVNNGSCSRFDIALKIVEFMGLEKSVKVRPVDSASFSLAAPRGRSEMLCSDRLSSLGCGDMPHWEEALREYIEINRDKHISHDEESKYSHTRV